MPRLFPDLVRRVSRGYGIPIGEARRLLATPVFTIALDDLTDEEATDVFSNRPGMGQGSLTAAAAQLAHVQILNPVGSGVISIVNLVLVSSNTAQRLVIRTHDTALTTHDDLRAFRDRRIDGNPATEVRSQSSAAALGTLIGTFRIAADETLQIPLDFVLGVGNGILVNAETVQTFIDLTFFFTEEDARD